jgi:hypothetical protein
LLPSFSEKYQPAHTPDSVHTLMPCNAPTPEQHKQWNKRGGDTVTGRMAAGPQATTLATARARTWMNCVVHSRPKKW